MSRIRLVTLMIAALALAGGGCSYGPEPLRQPSGNLKELVRPIQQSVVTVVNYDVDGEISSIGSGFFISESGILVTNFHVLEGAYSASIRTVDGSQYPVSAVLAKNRLVDLIKVRVDIAGIRVTPVVLAREQPAVADSVFVVGSPMGLEQTVSEGIISAVREMPVGGKVFQLTAPISRGSSGGPVINQDGKVVGVVTFQVARGQNLNFAVSVDALEMLTDEASQPSITEWTIRDSSQGPALAAALCSKGSRLTIQGEYEEALTYFKRAAEASPDDPEAWYGLGSCYVGLDQQEEAIAAYKRPIEQDPDNDLAHFILAMYYKAIGQFDRVIPALKEVIRVDPTNLRAQFELGRAYGALERTGEQIDTFREILNRQPDHMPTLLDLGATLGKIGRFEEAMVLFTRAGGLEPDNELIYYNMGVTYHRMDRTEAAIRAYTLAIRANPRMAAAHYNLGMIYFNQGRRKLALDQYEILKGLASDSAEDLFERIYPESTK
ncbi:tetratricopeptide repeat protein [Desulfosarcina sp.]|uniref:tetratricopeptide repeat protein n=1 Tax=Desulfosarcina sp. TaxID=2027861 RepID=UPI003562AB9F